MRIPTSRTGPVCDFDRTVTPMVDVIFQLLVFFVLASGGRVGEHSLSTVRSAAGTSTAEIRPAAKPSAELWIRLAVDRSQRETRIELGGRRQAEFVALGESLKKVIEPSPDSVAILDIAGDVPLGEVIQVYDACRSAKVRSINFAAAPEEVQAAASPVALPGAVTFPKGAKASPQRPL